MHCYILQMKRIPHTKMLPFEQFKKFDHLKMCIKKIKIFDENMHKPNI